MEGVRSLLAPNPGPITLDGTRTYLVAGPVESGEPARPEGVGERGRRAGAVAVIDPGPAIESHIERIAAAVAGAERAVILLTHAHDDHAAAASLLAGRIGADVHGPGGRHDLVDGQSIDLGGSVELVAVATPGHARRHFCFHSPSMACVFVGDLLLGEGATTWVGEYPGSIADYLASLDAIEALRPRVLHPAHGPDLDDPAAAIASYRDHRLARIEMVRGALTAGHAAPDAITRSVYGDLPPELHDMARAGVESMLDYISAPAAPLPG